MAGLAGWTEAVAAPPGYPDEPACARLCGAGDRRGQGGHEDYEHHESSHLQVVVDTATISTISINGARGDACRRDLVSGTMPMDID